MTEMGDANVMGGNVVMPFRKHLVRRKGKVPQMVEYEEEDEGINAPRSILLGRLLDKETGEDIGPFNLPIDDLWHEPSILLLGGPGTGKSVASARIISELAFESGRSVIICDFKGQYFTISEPNHNREHVKILREFGEEPRGMGEVKVWLPNHIVERYGEEYCQIKYNYDESFLIKTQNMDAGGLLLLGGKATEGKDYVQLLDTLLNSLKKAEREEAKAAKEEGRKPNVAMRYTLDNILDNLNDLREELPGSKRSVNSLEVMLNNLITSGVISDSGNSIFDLIEKPKTDGTVGKISIFNTGSAGPEDVQSKGVIANLLNGIVESLKTEFMEYETSYINVYRPILWIEESSAYFSPSSGPMVMGAFNSLQYINGRTLCVLRGYVYQTKNQIPKGLLESDSLPIFIKLQQFLKLRDEDGNEVGEINDKGLCIVSIKNVSFMKNQDFYVKILPPRCDIRS